MQQFHTSEFNDAHRSNKNVLKLSDEYDQIIYCNNVFAKLAKNTDKIKWNETSLIVNKLSRQRCGHRRG